ncbi:MAG: TonB-dependent receptor [Opitutaceae bacterium]|nr:TonB-dependent receptor [Opitutaceae bacterium]
MAITIGSPRLRLGLGLLTAGLAVSGGLSGQASPHDPEGLADLALEQLAQVPVEFVTGASKYEQSIRRAPASVTVLSAEDIANFNWRTLGAALNSTPGLHIRTDRFYDYLGNRGFTRPYDYNARTLILVNGHRINDSIYQQGPIGSEFLLDPELISRIEIIRGPGSSVYGSSAFYGAVNVIPKKASDFAGGEVSVTVDNTLGVKGRATIGNRTANGIEYVLSVSGMETPGEKDFTLPQDWRDNTGLPDIIAHKRDGTSYKSLYSNLRWGGLEWETAYGKRVKQVLPVVYYTHTRDPSWGMDERAYSLFRYTAAPSPDSTLVAKVAWDHYRYGGRFSPAFANFHIQQPFSRAASVNAEVRWRQQIRGGHILIAGVEYQNNIQQNLGRNDLTLNQTAVSVKKSSYFTSPFVQADWTLAETLFLSTGARYDDYSTGENRWTPRVGLMWEATPRLTAKLIYGESFRVPNVEERFAQELGVVRNDNIRAEKNFSWEAVLSYKPTEAWTLEGNFYSTSAEDLIQSVPWDPDPTQYTYANRQEIVTRGAELSATAFFKSDVQIRISSTIQLADDKDQPSGIFDAPRYLNKLSISAPLGRKDLRGSVEFLAVSKRHDSSGANVDDYYVANASIRALRIWRRWEVTLSAYNLFNQRWQDPKNVGQVLSPPRTIAIRSTLDF